MNENGSRGWGSTHLPSVPPPTFPSTYILTHTHTYAHTHTCTHAKSIHISPECLPVGSIPSAAVAVLGGGGFAWGGCLPRGCLSRGVSA